MPRATRSRRRGPADVAARRPAPLLGLLGLLGSALLVGGCGAPYDLLGTGDGDQVLCRRDTEAAPVGVRSYRDVLPNTRFRTAGTRVRPAPLTPLVVVGEVTDVAPGPGWTGAGDRVGFDDPDAVRRHARVRVAVAEVIGSAGWAAATVTVAFVLAPDDPLESLRSRLGDATWVLPLYRSATVAYDPALWSVGPAEAALLAEVGAGGRLTLPCPGPGRSRRLLADVPTLAALREAAARPVRERVVRPAYLG